MRNNENKIIFIKKLLREPIEIPILKSALSRKLILRESDLNQPLYFKLTTSLLFSRLILFPFQFLSHERK